MPSRSVDLPLPFSPTRNVSPDPNSRPPRRISSAIAGMLAGQAAASIDAPSDTETRRMARLSNSPSSAAFVTLGESARDRRQRLARGEHLVDQAVLERLLCGEDLVA